MTTLCACSFYYLMPGLKTREFIRFRVAMQSGTDVRVRRRCYAFCSDAGGAGFSSCHSRSNGLGKSRNFGGADYDWELVPDGALALPPETNVEATDWQVDASTSRQL